MMLPTLSFFQKPSLYALLDAGSFGEEWSLPSVVSYADQLLSDGIKILQIRDKKMRSDEERRVLTHRIAEGVLSLKEKHDFLLIINDDVDLCLAVKADGLHIGKEDQKLENCRARLGSEFLIGYSSHSLVEAVEAQSKGASYVAFGAVFPTANKGPGHPIQGCERLKSVVEALTVPVVAIGGIQSQNLKSVWDTGVGTVAMISALRDPIERNRVLEIFSQQSA